MVVGQASIALFMSISGRRNAKQGLIAFGMVLIVWAIYRGLSGSPTEVLTTFIYVPRNRTEIRNLSAVDRLGLANYALPKLLDDLMPLDVREVSRRARLFAHIHPIPTRPVAGELGRVLERHLYGYVLDKYGSITGL